MKRKVNRGKTSAVLMLLCLTLAIFQVPLVHAGSQKGPRSDMLDINFYYSLELCYAGLKAGEIDIMAYPITEDMYDNLIYDENVLLAPYPDAYEMRGFNLNINETINTYKGVTSPLNDTTFRKALAFLVDKDFIVNGIFEGFAERVDVPFPAAQSDWWNTSVCYPNYPYEFSFDQAEQLLDEAGFVDRDNDSIRNYPIGWPKREEGPNLDPIVFCVDSTDGQRAAMGHSLRDNMLAVGIPVHFLEDSPYLLFGRIMVDHDYHIYVGSQISYRYPIWWCILVIGVFTFLSFGQQWEYAELWQYMPYIHKILETTGINPLLQKIWCASSWDETVESVKKAQGIYVENVFEIPVCSINSYFAYRKNLAGIVNEQGFGIDNAYTFLNAYRTDDSTQPIRVGIVNKPMLLNPLYSVWQQDYQCLDKIYAGLLSYQPYCTAIDQPWVAQDWQVSTWFDPEDEEEKTVVDYWFRKDVYWVKPVTGDLDGQFTAEDYEFTCHYIYAQYPYIPEAGMGCPHLDKFKDIHHIEIVDDFHVRVYMNVQSMWAYLWPTYPLLPKHIWLEDPLAYEEEEYFEVDSDITLPGKIPLSYYVVSGSKDTDIRVWLVNGAEEWLEWGTDFMWKRGDLYIKTDSLNGIKIDKVWVYYWRNGAPRGFYPGGLPWQDILEGCGTHYVTNIDPGYYFLCDTNRHFFLETPTLGEIDWMWTWQGTTKPRSGYYQVNLYDAVKVLNAYGSRGDGVPSQNWFPGADIDKYDVGHVCLYDMAIITTNYGKKFGTPPP